MILGWPAHRAGITSRRATLASLALLAGLVLAGCGSAGASLPEQSPAGKNLAAVARAYHGFSSEHQRSPRSAKELKGWVSGLSAAERQEMGIEDVEATFTSPRDQQPVVIVPVRRDGGSTEVIAYEKVGDNGKHLTVDYSGLFAEVDAQELRQLLQEAKNPPGEEEEEY